MTKVVSFLKETNKYQRQLLPRVTPTLVTPLVPEFPEPGFKCNKLVLALQETPESVSICLTATAPVALNWRL